MKFNSISSKAIMDEQQVLNTYFQWQSEYFDKLMKVALPGNPF